MRGTDITPIFKRISSNLENEDYIWQDDSLFNYGAQFAGFVVEQVETLPPMSPEQDMYYLVYDRLGWMSMGLLNDWLAVLLNYKDILFALDPYLTIGKKYEATELEKIEIIIHSSMAIIQLYPDGHYQDAMVRLFRELPGG